MARWKIIIRHGPAVDRRSFDSLEDAISLARSRTDEIRAEGPLAPVKSLRDYEPDQLVNARIEITGRGILKPPTAGLDIKGDGSLVPFRGGVARKPLPASDDEDIFGAIRQYLSR